MNEKIVFSHLSFFLETSQRLSVVVAHVAEDGERWNPRRRRRVRKRLEPEHLRPSQLTSDMIDCKKDIV